MPKPSSKVVVINDDPLILKELLKGLNAAARSLDNPFGICFIGAADPEQGLQRIAEDGDVQLVVVDDKLAAATAAPARRSRDAAPAAPNLVRRISALRPEIEVYVLIEKAKADQVVDTLFAEAVHGYFYREEHDYRGMFRILNAQIAERARTPFFDALRSYVASAKDAWHTPGHFSGDALRGSPWVDDFYQFMGENVFTTDLSVSVKTLDSLMDPTGVVADAQQMAAKAFGARRTLFATNGTSTANKVILQTLIKPGEKLLLDRNCHKSIHHGVVLSGARPIYLDSSVNRQYGIFGPVPRATILRAIENHPDARLLVLTSCTYDGLRYDLQPIIEAAHAHQVKVLIDEAWYSHARFHPALRPTALEAGADYVTQSAHKTLSAFSQGALIHVNDPDLDDHSFRENFNMHTSTSPMYSMIASLDVGRRQAVMEGYKLLQRALALAEELRVQIDSTGTFHALSLDELLPQEVKRDGIRLDPTKITVDISACGLTVDELRDELFNRFNITVEKSTFNTITLLLTIGTTRSKCSRLYDALRRIARERRAPRRLYRAPVLPPFTALHCLPRDAYYSPGELVGLLDEDEQVNRRLLGRVCADQIVPYPPGIPVLVPGQVINETVIEFLVRTLRVQGTVELHGVVFQGYLPAIRVLSAAEQKRLSAAFIDTSVGATAGGRKKTPRAPESRSAMANSTTGIRHFLQLADFSRTQIEHVIDRARIIKGRFKRYETYQPLTDRTLAMVFEKASTRTRVSFEAGMYQMGGSVIHLTTGDSQLGRAEPIEDTARVISRMVDIVMIRTYEQTKIEHFAAHSRVPVINGLTNEFHPCQILADIFTYEEQRGSIAGRTVAWIGDANNMAYTWLQAAQLLGFNLHISTPPGYRLDPRLAPAGDHYRVLDDPLQAAQDADLVTTDVWTSMGFEAENEARRTAFAPWCVDQRLMAQARSDALFMHCLPAHRGEEVAAQVIDGPQSVVWDEAENRLHVQKALMEYLLLGVEVQ